MFSNSTTPDREPKYKIGDIVVSSRDQKEEVVRITDDPKWIPLRKFGREFGITIFYSWAYSATCVFIINCGIKTRVEDNRVFSYFEENIEPFQEYVDKQIEVLEKRRELLLKFCDDCYEIQSKRNFNV